MYVDIPQRNISVSYTHLSAYDMTEKGEEYLNKAFDIKGNSAGDYAWRGRIYYYLGQYDNCLLYTSRCV